MRLAIGYILLSVILLSEMMTFMPWLEYSWNYEYISQVLCINQDEEEQSCNGKCYLMSQIAEAEDNKSSPDKRVPVKDLDKTLFVFQVPAPLRTTTKSSLRNSFLERVICFNNIDVIPPTPPPKI